MPRETPYDQMEKWIARYYGITSQLSPILIVEVAELLFSGSQIIVAGNGGSYANATHIAGDILANTPYIGNTICLGDNLVSFTALSNDHSYQQAMAKEYALRHRKDTSLLVLSTSGASKNILELVDIAYKMGAHVVSITGKNVKKSLVEKSIINMKLNDDDAGLLESCFDLIGHLIVKEMQNHLDESFI